MGQKQSALASAPPSCAAVPSIPVPCQSVACQPVACQAVACLPVPCQGHELVSTITFLPTGNSQCSYDSTCDAKGGCVGSGLVDVTKQIKETNTFDFESKLLELGKQACEEAKKNAGNRNAGAGNGNGVCFDIGVRTMDMRDGSFMEARYRCDPTTAQKKQANKKIKKK